MTTKTQKLASDFEACFNVSSIVHLYHGEFLIEFNDVNTIEITFGNSLGSIELTRDPLYKNDFLFNVGHVNGVFRLIDYTVDLTFLDIVIKIYELEELLKGYQKNSALIQFFLSSDIKL